MKELQVFKNAEFGSVRTLTVGGEPYFATLEIPNRGLTVINESGLYSLILSSKLPAAKRFKE